MKQRALLLVDLQNDFCAGGALAVAEGDSTVDVANTLIDWCKTRGEAVVASQDWHPVTTVALPASTTLSHTARVNWTDWRKLSGPITAYSRPRARSCTRCSIRKPLMRCSIKGKPGHRQLQRLFRQRSSSENGAGRVAAAP